VPNTPGSAIVWWIPRDFSQVRETGALIGTLAQLCAAANNTEAPDLFWPMVNAAVLPGSAGSPQRQRRKRPTGAHRTAPTAELPLCVQEFGGSPAQSGDRRGQVAAERERQGRRADHASSRDAAHPEFGVQHIVVVCRAGRAKIGA
jgi:hypothetical protein